MSDPRIAQSTANGISIEVRFGSDYRSWTSAQREQMVTAFANADACVSGKARDIEFRSPDGRVIARADGVRGVRMTSQ